MQKHSKLFSVIDGSVSIVILRLSVLCCEIKQKVFGIVGNWDFQHGRKQMQM